VNRLFSRTVHPKEVEARLVTHDTNLKGSTMPPFYASVAHGKGRTEGLRAAPIDDRSE